MGNTYIYTNGDPSGLESFKQYQIDSFEEGKKNTFDLTYLEQCIVIFSIPFISTINKQHNQPAGLGGIQDRRQGRPRQEPKVSLLLFASSLLQPQEGSRCNSGHSERNGANGG